MCLIKKKQYVGFESIRADNSSDFTCGCEMFYCDPITADANALKSMIPVLLAIIMVVIY